MNSLYGFLIIIALLVLAWIMQIRKLRKEYDQALSGTDKKQALIAGRKYYRMLRRGYLTIYDEQAITNDLSTMDDE